MRVRFIPHNKTSQELLLEIIKVKMAAWPYPLNEQTKWVENNINNEDIHVILLNEKEEIVAYLNLIRIGITINDIPTKAFGIGNVCSLHRGQGYGSKLINKTNSYLIKKQIIGLLFCNTNLTPFYQKLNWKIIPNKNCNIKEIKSNIYTLVFNFKSEIKNIKYNGKLF